MKYPLSILAQIDTDVLFRTYGKWAVVVIVCLAALFGIGKLLQRGLIAAAAWFKEIVEADRKRAAEQSNAVQELLTEQLKELKTERTTLLLDFKSAIEEGTRASKGVADGMEKLLRQGGRKRQP